MSHISVLLHEVIEALSPEVGGVFLDGTFGAGGHSLAIAKRIGKTGTLISFDADAKVFESECAKEIASHTNFISVNRNFREIGDELMKHADLQLDGALFDLGLSSTQLEVSGRGFSFLRDEPLLMTFKDVPVAGDVTAREIVNHWSEDTLTTILRGFGEERFARAIAKGIIHARGIKPIETTSELVAIIETSTPGWYQRGRTHYATRTFQALRMAANDELGAIEAGINGVLSCVKQGGHIAVISFHSIEDRLVKQYFRKLSGENVVEILTKKPIIPGDEELKVNPRSRSAKLRVIEKL